MPVPPPKKRMKVQPCRELKPYSMSNEEIRIVDQELQKLLDKGVITRWDKNSAKYLSNIFLREKKNGSFRLILNLNELNQKLDPIVS